MSEALMLQGEDHASRQADSCTTEFAIALCQEFECALAGKWHIGLTGSCLYGRAMCGPNDDIDVIIYPHVGDDGSTPMEEPEVVLAHLGIVDVEHSPREYPDVVHYIYVGRHSRTGIKIDAFFLGLSPDARTPNGISVSGEASPVLEPDSRRQGEEKES